MKEESEEEFDLFEENEAEKKGHVGESEEIIEEVKEEKVIKPAKKRKKKTVQEKPRKLKPRKKLGKPRKEGQKKLKKVEVQQEEIVDILAEDNKLDIFEENNEQEPDLFAMDEPP